MSFVLFEERSRDLKSYCCMYRRKKKEITVLYAVNSSLARGSTSPADSACFLGRGSPCLALAFVVFLSSALLGRRFAASGLASLGGLFCFPRFCFGLLGDFLHRFPARALRFWAGTRSGACLGAWPCAWSWAGSGSLYFKFKWSATFDEGFWFHPARQGEPQLQSSNSFCSRLRCKVGQDGFGAWSLAVFQRSDGFGHRQSGKGGPFSSLSACSLLLLGYHCFPGTSASFGHFRTVLVNVLTELKKVRLDSSVASGKWLNS